MSTYPYSEHVTPQQLRGTERSPVAIPRWVAAAVIVGALLTTAGAVLSKVAPTILLENGDHMTSAVQVYADYLFARNLPLALLSLLLLVIGARRMLAGFMVLTALIQTLDVVNDLAGGRFTLIPGLMLFAIVFLVGASRLLGEPVWHTDAWRENATSCDAARHE